MTITINSTGSNANDGQLVWRAKELAAREGKTMTEVLRIMLGDYVEQLDPDGFIDRYGNYKRSGSYIQDRIYETRSHLPGKGGDVQ